MQRTLARAALALVAVFTLGSCDSNENREEGICYCEFFSGDKSQYDLRALPRAEQTVQCRQHDTNAGAFGGECELE